MTGAEAAAALGVSRRTLYRWHEKGMLYRWQWTPEDIEERRAALLAHVPTGDEVARALGVSRRTLYRWSEEGRLEAWQWGQVDAMPKRPRGPKRNPRSKRYHEGRHRFERTQP